MTHDFNHLLLEQSPDAIMATSSDGELLYWSSAAEQIFGYTSLEALGQSLNDLIVPADRIEAEDRVVRDALHNGFATYEALRKCKDSTLVYVDITSKAVRGSDGDVDYLLSSNKDVTHLRALRDAKLVEARFRDVLESMPDGIVMVNATGRIVLATSQAEQLFGYERGEMHGMLIDHLLPARHRAVHLRHRSRYFADPRTRAMGASLELSGLRKDGGEFSIEITLSRVQTEDGTLVISAIRDTTARKRGEQKFKSLLEAAPDAIVIVDRSGEMVVVNSQTEKLFGYPREQLLGQKMEMLVPERFRDVQPWEHVNFFGDVNVPASTNFELCGLRQDGSEFPAEITTSPLETEDGLLVSSAIRDITERKRFERTLQEKNLELASANQAKDRFLATMSHELRTPLNAIIGFTATLLMKLPGPLTADQDRQLRTVQSSGRQLLALINDLLDLAKIEAGKLELHLEPTVCQSIVTDVVAVLQPQAESKGLQLEVSMPISDTLIETERRAVSQIILNLTSNAIKFTDRGYVRITLDEQALEGSKQICVSVEDSGIGIRPDDQRRLFQAFTQAEAPTHRYYEGSGLGLHLSQKLAGLLGGEITFRSEYGKGSTFTLILGAH